MTEHRHSQIVDGCVPCDVNAANAEDEHEACLWRWSRLTAEQRAGTTFHAWQAHLRATS